MQMVAPPECNFFSRPIRKMPRPTAKFCADQRFPTVERIRDVRQGPDGLLYLLTDYAEDAALLRIAPAP